MTAQDEVVSDSQSDALGKLCGSVMAGAILCSKGNDGLAEMQCNPEVMEKAIKKCCVRAFGSEAYLPKTHREWKIYLTEVLRMGLKILEAE